MFQPHIIFEFLFDYVSTTLCSTMFGQLFVRLCFDNFVFEYVWTKLYFDFVFDHDPK